MDVPLPQGETTGSLAPEELIGWFGALGEQLFFTEDFHRDEATGRVLRVRRRPVPSAGATYPVQLHLRLGGWRLAYDQEHNVVHDLSAVLTTGDQPIDLRPTAPRVRLTFTVLPGRSFSRYRHRAWTLWIADVVYAVEGARYALGGGPLVGAPHDAGPTVLAGEAGLPDSATWPTSYRELAVQGLDVGRVGPPHVGALKLPALRRLPDRRSIPLAVLAADTESSEKSVDRAPDQQQLLDPVHCSGQRWPAEWTHMRLFTVPRTTDPMQLRRQLVSVHRQAAQITYTEAEAGRQVRPVSGFTDVPGRPDRCLHALALQEHHCADRSPRGDYP
ncbi:hypothetical protein GCM10011401_27330 [Nesterenkonia cremea]|uniref:Uncharacterized protein n=1 Tax=Nesterenkonia cremea TaxID=1882340 RepID=A0A917AV93_9MICC|nr:hypothetical protein GCM10011401_27330 [Nesterenkonia cremea]